jgi:GNAT superfamily N-acetyltransferase
VRKIFANSFMEGGGSVGAVLTRGFARGDAEALVAVWNRSLPADPTTLGWLRDCVLLDPNFDRDGLRVALVGDQLAGAAYAVRRLTPHAGTELDSDTGWVPFFFVHPDYRGRGIGARLLTEALDFLRAAGRSRVEFAPYTPYYVLPGIDEVTYPAGFALLRKLGFSTLYSPVAMDRSLVGYATPADVIALRRKREAEGYAFRTPGPGDLPDLVAFAAHEFAPDWGEAIRDSLHRGTPLDRFIVALETQHQDRIVGFSTYGAYQGVRERFGPFGVEAAQRGTGLGKILLHETMTRMRAEGLHASWFLWTGEESPAGHLYKAAGYEVTRQFHVMRRTEP